MATDNLILRTAVQTALHAVASNMVELSKLGAAAKAEKEKADSKRDTFLIAAVAQLGGVWPPVFAKAGKGGMWEATKDHGTAEQRARVPYVSPRLEADFAKAAREYASAVPGTDANVVRATIGRWIKWARDAGCYRTSDATPAAEDLACAEIIKHAKAKLDTKGKSMALIMKDRGELIAWAAYLGPSVTQCTVWAKADQDKADADAKAKADAKASKQRKAKDNDLIEQGISEGRARLLASLPPELRAAVERHSDRDAATVTDEGTDE